MFRAIGTFLGLLIGCAISAQPIYFDRLHDFSAQIEILRNVVLDEDGYTFATYSLDLSADTAVVSFFRMDPEGNEFLSTVYNPGSRTMRAGNLILHSDSGYVFFNSIGDTIDGGLDFQLIRYDDEGAVVYTKEYIKDGNDYLFRPVECANGDFAMCGQGGYSDGTDPDIMLIRTDNVGSEQWRKFYGGNQYEGGADLIETPDGGFLLLGWTRSFGAGLRDFYLVRTDAQGNELWHETYGTSAEEIGKSIIRLSDGNYLLTGSGSNPSGSGSVGRIYKVEPNAEERWSETYAYNGNTSNEFHHAIELPNGALVITGATGAGGSAGWLIKTDSVGLVEWQREYDKNENTDLFYSVLATDDGGFLLSGQAINEATNSQDAWLLKVDSVGCPYPNCTVGIDEVEKTVMVDVWPNPCTDVLNIELLQPGVAEVRLVDMAGRTVTSPDPSLQGGERLRMDVSTIASGLYLLQIVQNGSKTAIRIVVQR